MMRKDILILIALLFVAPAFATTYYVRSDGHDTNCNGTDDASSASAPNCAYLTVQKAANVAAAGDTVTVKGTNTYAERVTISTNGGTGNASNGTCSSWITFQGSPSRTATTYGFRIAGNCVEVKDFNVLGSVGANQSCADPDCTDGITIRGSYIKATNNYISNWRDQPGITMSTEGTVWATRGAWVTISNNTIYNSQNGISVWGDNVTVTGNEVNRLRSWDNNNDCDYSRAWGSNITISNNFFHGTVRTEIAQGAIHAHVDCLQTFAYHGGSLSNLTFDNNWCSDAHSSGMIQGTNTNVNFTNNVVWPNGMTSDSGVLGTGAEIDAATGASHTGNTYYGTSTGPYCASSVTGCVIRSNLVYNVGTYAWQCWGDCVEDYNLAYRSGAPIYNESPGHSGSSTWNANSIHDIDPLLVNTSSPLGPDGLPFTSDDGFRLQATSVAIDNGYLGVDMGAYEYGSVDTTPDAFSFTDNTDVASSTVIYSDSITVAGITDNTSISLTGTGCFYQVNGAGSWLTSGDNVYLNDTIALKTTSLASASTPQQTSCNLVLGGSVSDTWYVTTIAVPTIPTLISPSDDAPGLTRPITFTWGAVEGAELYQIQIATDSAFTDIVIDVQTVNTSYEATTLLPSMRYYWRVRALQ